MLTVNTKTSMDAVTTVLSSQNSATTKPDEKEQAEIQRLKERDAEVKKHEEAHKQAASGIFTVGPKYSYEVGPDGKRYAVSGDVQIDIAEVSGNPEATIKKAQQIRRAALAPAEPSAQDKIIAAKATQMELKAKNEINESKASDSVENKESVDKSADLAQLKYSTYNKKGKLNSDEPQPTTIDVVV